MAKKVPAEQMSLLELLLLGTPAPENTPAPIPSNIPNESPNQEAPSEPLPDHSSSSSNSNPLASSPDKPTLELKQEEATPIFHREDGTGASASDEHSISTHIVEQSDAPKTGLPEQTIGKTSANEIKAQTENEVVDEPDRDLGAELLEHGAASDLGSLNTKERSEIQAVLNEAARQMLAGDTSGDLYDIAVRVAFRQRINGELLRLMGKAGINRLSLLGAWPGDLPITAQGQPAELYREWVATRPDGAVATVRPGFCRDRSGGLMPHTDLACAAWMLPEERFVRTANIRRERIEECKRQFLTRGFSAAAEGYPIHDKAIELLERWANGRTYREISGSWRVDSAGRVVFFVDRYSKNYMFKRRPEFAAQVRILGYRCRTEESRILMVPDKMAGGMAENAEAGIQQREPGTDFREGGAT